MFNFAIDVGNCVEIYHKSGEKMFIGSFNYSIDSKGRIAIPAKLRKALSPAANETFVMTRGMVKCIDLYPLDIWNELKEKKFNQLNIFSSKDAAFIRLFLDRAAVDKLDSQQRLLIPRSLIEYAEIDKEVFILGALQKIEIWNPKNYEEYIKENEELFEQIANEVMNSSKQND